jgi:hypothetical protein
VSFFSPWYRNEGANPPPWDREAIGRVLLDYAARTKDEPVVLDLLAVIRKFELVGFDETLEALAALPDATESMRREVRLIREAWSRQ